jgi:TRAP-type mannitol/chloroaromatic compound transport system permease large subunit
MIEIIAHNLAPIMFVTVMAMLLLGYPVAFTLAGGGLFYFLVGLEASHLAPSEIHLSTSLLSANVNRIFDVMRNETLLAVPFFTLMGLILERSGMAEDLLDTVGQLFGGVRGGVAYAVIFVGALLGATTGVVAASVLAMGLISLPIMARYGYNTPIATGTILGAGTLAQIVPPSLVLIVLADQLGQPVGRMYSAALIPAALVIGLYCAWIFVVSIVRPAAVPALPAEARTLGKGVGSLFALIALSGVLYFASRTILDGLMRRENAVVLASVVAVAGPLLIALANDAAGGRLISRLAEKVVLVMVPPLTLIFLVLGTIFLGIATPTEGGAMGAAGALALALARRRLDFAGLRQALESTTRLTAFVMFILIGARVFSLTFYGLEGDRWVEEVLTAIPGGELGFLIAVTALVFILGCFLDFFEIAFIVIPFIAVAARALEIDMVWLGILLALNLQASFLTPPFGFALFYLRSVAPSAPWVDVPTGRTMPAIRSADFYRGVVPFVFLQLVAIGIVMAFPQLTGSRAGPPAALPASESAPPAPLETPGLSMPELSLPELPVAQ